jgi:hypothetical protein
MTNVSTPQAKLGLLQRLFASVPGHHESCDLHKSCHTLVTSAEWYAKESLEWRRDKQGMVTDPSLEEARKELMACLKAIQPYELALSRKELASLAPEHHGKVVAACEDFGQKAGLVRRELDILKRIIETLGTGEKTRDDVYSELKIVVQDAKELRTLITEMESAWQECSAILPQPKPVPSPGTAPAAAM